MTRFELTMTRDFPLVQVEVWSAAFTTEMEKLFGFEWISPVYWYRNGAVESWRPESFHKNIPQRVASWLAISSNVEKLFRSFDVYEKVLQQLHRETDAFGSEKDNFTAVESALQVLTRASAPLIALYWIAEWDDRAKRNVGGARFPEYVVARASSLRRYDTLFSDVAELLYRHLESLAREKILARSSMRLLLLNELQQVAARNELDMRTIQERSKGYMYFWGNITLTPDIQKELSQRGFILVNAEVGAGDEISGQSAYPGKAQGVVRLVRNRDELVGVKQGEILVASNTEPYYVPVLSRVAAIITDEGGVMSHAAIISREMKIPCVIGTKVASHFFKTGDHVEVDAAKGIVRKLPIS